LGIGDWGLGPIPNPQSPIPNPQSPNGIFFTYLIPYYLILKFNSFSLLINLPFTRNDFYLIFFNNFFMKSLRQVDILILLSLFVFTVHTIKLRGDKPIKYTQANCELYTEDNTVPIEEIVHPQFSADKTREDLLHWLINANPNVDKSELNEFIDKLVEDGTTKLLPDNTHFVPISTPDDLPGDLLDIDSILAKDKKTNSENKPPADNNSSNSSSSSSTLPPSNPDNSSSSTVPPSNSASVTSSTVPPSNSASVTSSTVPSSNSASNTSTTAPPSNSASDTSTTAPPSNNSSTNSSSAPSNSVPSQEKPAIIAALPQILKDAYNNATNEFITSNKINPANILPLPNDNPLKPKAENNTTPNITPSSSSNTSSATPTNPSSSSSNSSPSSDNTSNPEVIVNKDKAQDDFNLNRNDGDWKLEGPIGVTITSEGIIRCGNSLIVLYLIVSPGTVYNTANFPIDLSGDALLLWKTSTETINCFSNLVSVPFSIVADENEVIEESNKNRICFYGREVKSNEDLVLIRTRYYELNRGNTMGCDDKTWAPLMSDSFKILDNDKTLFAMNHCYCGVEGRNN